MTKFIVASCMSFTVACVEAHAPSSAQPLERERGNTAHSESLAEWSHILSRASSELGVETRADGTARVDLLGGFQSATLVLRVEGGAVRRVCVDDPRTFARLFGDKP